MSKGQGRGSIAHDWTGGNMEDGVETREAVEVIDHGIDFGLISIGFDFEENDVLDDSRRIRGGHSDRRPGLSGEESSGGGGG